MRKFLLLTFTVATLFANAATNPGFLGVTINDFKSEKINGVLITDVIKNSAAQKFGIKENDIITAINDVVVLTKEDLTKLVASYNIGDVVKVSFVRNGVATYNKVVLGKKPEVIRYKMTKTIKEDGEHWFFANDKTEIIVKNDNTPVSISKTDESGKATDIVPFASTSFNNIIQSFPDVEDKLESIRKNKKQVESCNCKCPIVNFTYFKITPDAEEKSVVNDILLVDKFTIAPNPSDGKFVVDFASKEKGALQFSIIDVAGKTVKSETINNFDGFYNKQINIENEAKGVYFIQFQIGNKLSTKKIALQ
jgi:membrane-associated protease RseP (regulator of RpoE activity)